jgi:hypothetical protein
MVVAGKASVATAGSLLLQVDKKTAERFTVTKLWHSSNHRDW